MILISSPYSHDIPTVVKLRIAETLEFVVWAMKKKLPVISIPVHFHQLVVDGRLPSDGEFWKDYYLRILNASTALYVLMIDGWSESTGVANEIKYAQRSNIPIFYIKKIGYDYKIYKEVNIDNFNKG